MPVWTYSPGGIIVTWGPITFLGFAEDEFVKVTRTSPLYTKKMGADGRGSRSMSMDESGLIEVMLLRSSPTNDLLSAEVKLDRLGLGVHPFQISDLNGTALVHAAETWISKYPDWARGKEDGDHTWSFESLKVDIDVGSNSVPA